jgi:two-component system response regulator YesN
MNTTFDVWIYDAGWTKIYAHKNKHRPYLPSTMQIAHSDFTPRYPKINSMPSENILSRNSRLRLSDSVAPVTIPVPAKDACDAGARAEIESTHRVGQSREFMKRHLDQPITIAVLAARAGVSVSHFFKLFKEDTGCAPLVYLTRLKMERARDWLATTDWSIKLIAMDLGYHDPLYFSRVFKSFIGMAPKAYRHSKKNGQTRSLSGRVR